MHISTTITQRTNTFKKLCAIFLSVFLLSNFIGYDVPRLNASTQISTNNSVTSISSIVSNSSISTTSSSSNSETKVIATNQFSGDISRKEGNKLYVTKDSITKEYTLSPGIVIRKDTFNSSFDQLQVGDSVTVKESTNTGVILSIDAISKQVFDYSKWLIPGIIILILLAILAYYFYRKSNTGHIQTNNVTRS
jgi:ATP-dependent Zn protease